MKSNMENTGKKLKFSIGEVTYGSTTGVYRNIAVDGREVATFCNEDDATLFADALSTIQKFGLMPSELIDKVEKLQAFKDYVHDRLDKMDVEKDPESIHKEAGCRIGGRLDILQQQRDELLELLAHMRPIYKEDSDLFYKYENKKDELIYKNKRT